MALSFQCPHCQTTHSASKSLIGRRVRCPGCDEFVEVTEEIILSTDDPEDDAEENGLGTVNEASSGDTVLLEAVDVHEAIDHTEPLDVSEAIADEVVPPPRAREPKPKPKQTEEEEEPAPLAKKDRTREETEMDMTPMVDVTFLLLIFFMVTAAFALQKAIEVPKPSADEASTNAIPQDPQDNPDYVTVRVDEFNTYNVTTVEWEEEAPSVQDLHIQLRRARDGDSAGTVPSKLLVEAHGEATHGRVVSALDAGTATGFEEVQLTTVEEED